MNYVSDSRTQQIPEEQDREFMLAQLSRMYNFCSWMFGATLPRLNGCRLSLTRDVALLPQSLNNLF